MAFEHHEYSQWERTKPRTNISSALPSSNKTPSHICKSAEQKHSPFNQSISFDNLSIYTSRIGSACSLSRCQHPWNNYRAIEAENAARESRRQRMKEINVKIKLQESSLLHLKRRESALLQQNIGFFKEIDGYDRQSFGKVDNYLNQYDRSKDGMMKLQDRFAKEKISLENEISSTKETIENDLSNLKSQLEILDSEVRCIRDELVTLNNYKDKIYPERLLLIHSLKQRISSLRLNNEEAEADLMEIIQIEHDKLVSQDQEAVGRMNEEVAKTALAEVHPSVISMAEENRKLRNDIAFHKEQICLFENEIRSLQIKNRNLKKDPSATVQKSMFPHIYEKHEVCLPSDDVTLAIPVRQMPVL